MIRFCEAAQFLPGSLILSSAHGIWLSPSRVCPLILYWSSLIVSSCESLLVFLQAIRTGWIHPNINLENPDEGVVYRCGYFIIFLKAWI